MKKNLKITERGTERSIPITCERRHIRTDMLLLSDGDAQPVTEVLFVFRKLNESLTMGDIDAGIMETDVPDTDIFPFLMKLGNFLKPVRQTGVDDLYFYELVNLQVFRQVSEQLNAFIEERRLHSFGEEDLFDYV